MVKRLPGGRRIRSVRVSAQTEPWRPDSCTGNIYNIFNWILILLNQSLSLVQLWLTDTGIHLLASGSRGSDPHRLRTVPTKLLSIYNIYNAYIYIYIYIA